MHVKATAVTIPITIYQELARDKEHGTAMEIPYTLRDGLEYIGVSMPSSINSDTVYQIDHWDPYRPH